MQHPLNQIRTVRLLQHINGTPFDTIDVRLHWTPQRNKPFRATVTLSDNSTLEADFWTRNDGLVDLHSDCIHEAHTNGLNKNVFQFTTKDRA